MGDRPDDFPCIVTNWAYIYGLCRDVADQVKAAEFEPDVVVALARGGWFPGRCCCDFLGLDDLTSLKMEHYVGAGQRSEEPVIRYPMPEGSVAGKDVLVVDDIADTGESLTRAVEYVDERDPADVRTATLQLMQESGFEPDFVGERLDRWAWIVYPWNFIEDLVELVEGVLRRTDAGPCAPDDVRALLDEHHDIGRIELEVAQPDRLDEVLDEMVRRGVVEPVDGGRFRLSE